MLEMTLAPPGGLTEVELVQSGPDYPGPSFEIFLVRSEILIFYQVDSVRDFEFNARSGSVRSNISVILLILGNSIN